VFAGVGQAPIPSRLRFVPVSEMTYTVSSVTLNSTIPYYDLSVFS